MKSVDKVQFNREHLLFSGLTEADIESLQKRYKEVDVRNELTRMIVWLNSPKGSARKGTMTFIVNWLENAVETAVRLGEANSGSIADVLCQRHEGAIEMLKEYLKDLWKNRESLLEFNTKSSP